MLLHFWGLIFSFFSSLIAFHFENMEYIIFVWTVIAVFVQSSLTTWKHIRIVGPWLAPSLHNFDLKMLHEWTVLKTGLFQLPSKTEKTKTILNSL